jgi:hypothetical protein
MNNELSKTHNLIYEDAFTKDGFDVTVSRYDSKLKPGTYKPTAIDEEKKNADIRVLQVGPYVVNSKIQLKGRGIKAMVVGGRYRVTESALKGLHSKYKVVTDF